VLDDGTPVEAFTIQGDGAYVDQGTISNNPTAHARRSIQ
jgi:hypothetical protein